MVGAVTYIRVSTKEQTENLSLSTQLKACEEYCERQGFCRPGCRAAANIAKTKLEELFVD